MSHHDPNQANSHANPSEQSAKQSGILAKFFKFEWYQTTIRIELLAGFTTFMTMAYILVVNPGILSDAIFLQASGDLFNELVIATALSTAIATLVMGLWANYPLALAPGMGLNAFFTYSVVLGLGIDWRIALSAILIEGLIFIALTLSNVRHLIVKAIPDCLKRATAAGIGLFIAYIGLSGAGIIAADAVTKTKLGDLSQPSTLIAIAVWILAGIFVLRFIVMAMNSGG